jgi:hypothetical protein
MTWLPLGDFGDLSRYVWFPPKLEDDLPPANGNAFLHPVLDRRRYISSMLDNRGSLAPGELNQALSRFRREEYAHLVWRSARKGAVRRIRHKLKKKMVDWRTQMSREGFWSSALAAHRAIWWPRRFRVAPARSSAHRAGPLQELDAGN